MDNLSSLPPEITMDILRLLPLQCLLGFGLTSNAKIHAPQRNSLSTLRPAVLDSVLLTGRSDRRDGQQELLSQCTDHLAGTVIAYQREGDPSST